MSEPNAQVDWLEAWMAHDSDHIYLAYRNDGAINTGTWWPWAIYLDTDANKASGFQVSANLGAEYLFEGGSLWKYTGTGENWSWSYVSGSISSVVANNTAEIKVTRSMLGNPNKIHLLFIGNNSPFSATGIDYYPNAANTYFSYQLSAGNSNTAPVANNQSLTVQSNNTVSVTLTANDAENDTLTYSIVSQPTHGSLTGIAPNIIYTPNVTYSGNDSFTFKVNDSQLDSNIASVNITVTPVGGGISNPATIIIDGLLDDWTNLQSFGLDGNDISLAGAQADWQEGWMAHDANNLYIAYTNYGAINTTHWWTWEVYLDTDSDSNTGYTLNGAIGADYLLDGGTLWKYTGTGGNWSWSYNSSTSTSNVTNNKAEIKLSRSSLGNPTSIKMIFRAGNGIFTGNYAEEGVDYYPNNTTTPFQYNMP